MLSRHFRVRRPLAGACTAVLAATMSLAAAAAPVTASTTTVVVKPSATSGWSFVQETATGSGSFVSGPATTPLGSGSARLQVDGTGGVALAAALFQGTRLDAIDTIAYSTYRASGSAALAPSFQFTADFDLTDSDTAFQGRLVFEPYLTPATVQTGMWQSWDAITGRWWATRSPFSATCSQAAPCTTADMLDEWPNAGIHASLGAIFLKAGGGWTGGFDGFVDALTFGVNGTHTIYDFEPETACSTVCYVDAVNGNDGYGGDSPSSAKRTIQAGVDAVADGGTVVVAAGTYDEQVEVVGKSVTIDGAGASTVIAPSAPVANSSSMFSGADVAAIVLAHAPIDTVTVKDVRIDGGGNGPPGCMTYTGIFFRGTDGSLLDSQVADVISSGNEGCQGAIGVFVQSGGGANAAVTIRGNTISGYGKNGITANESLTSAVIENNVVTGRGPVGLGDAAQNGMQIGFGATATIRGNTVTDHWYTPTDWAACGLLYVEANGVKASRNEFAGNEMNVCNAGRGGGRFQPSS